MKIIQGLLTVAICAVIAVTAAADEHDHLFKRFIEMHQKSYSDDSEKQMRLAIFKKNLIEIDELNERHNETDMFGITQFADWTAEEFEQILVSKSFIPESDNSTIKYEAEEDDLIEKKKKKKKKKKKDDKTKGIDWRKKKVVSPVRDQGSCSSFWAFAVISAIESAYKIRDKKNIDLSEQELIDCVKKAKGCKGGWPSEAFSYTQEVGTLPERRYPYEAKHVAFISPTIRHYKKGLYIPKDCEKSPIGQGWTIVGLEFHDDQPYWIIKNDLGTSWGEKGYIRFAAGKNLCYSEQWAFGPKL